MQDVRRVRNCILCGADDAAPMFTYTYSFLTEVHGMAPEAARAAGWTEDTTSTIVQCRKCGCIYVRDPVSEEDALGPDQAAAPSAEIARHVEAARQRDSFPTYQTRDEEAWIVRSLVHLAARRQRRDIRFLDFGAGGATACSVARVLGVRDVFAYDAYYAGYIQDILNRVNAPGITALRRREELQAHAPFDAVIFQSSVEHVADPRRELETIREIMSPGGYLYVNNPFMDLKRELPKLQSAKKIVKRDRISHYHPWHLNYMTPKEFRRLLEDCGFRLTNLALYPPPPLMGHLWRDWVRQMAKTVARTAQNALGLPYDRYVFVVERV